MLTSSDTISRSGYDIDHANVFVRLDLRFGRRPSTPVSNHIDRPDLVVHRIGDINCCMRVLHHLEGDRVGIGFSIRRGDVNAVSRNRCTWCETPTRFGLEVHCCQPVACIDSSRNSDHVVWKRGFRFALGVAVLSVDRVASWLVKLRVDEILVRVVLSLRRADHDVWQASSRVCI